MWYKSLLNLDSWATILVQVQLYLFLQKLMKKIKYIFDGGIV